MDGRFLISCSYGSTSKSTGTERKQVNVVVYLSIKFSCKPTLPSSEYQKLIPLRAPKLKDTHVVGFTRDSPPPHFWIRIVGDAVTFVLYFSTKAKNLSTVPNVESVS